MSETRVCSGCGKEKTLNSRYFYVKSKRGAKGQTLYRSPCKECTKKNANRDPEPQHAYRRALSRLRDLHYAEFREILHEENNRA